MARARRRAAVTRPARVMLTVTCHVSRVRSSHLHVARVPHQLRPSVSPQTVSTTAQQQSTAADLLWLCGCTGAAPLVQILSAELNLLSCPGQTAADWQCRYNYLGAQIIVKQEQDIPSHHAHAHAQASIWRHLVEA